MDLDRRTDPRTDLDFSLRNLLRARVRRHDELVAVLTTHDGLVVAESRPEGAPSNRLAELAAAHASTDAPLAEPGVRLARERFEVDGRTLLLAVLRADGRDGPGLGDLAHRVRAILAERRAQHR